MYELIKVNGHDHVVCSTKRAGISYYISENKEKQIIPAANYRNTGLALCGVLREGQDLDSFIKVKEFKENRLK